MTVTPARRRMDIGDAAYVYEHIMPANATNKCVLWSSCDPDVAAVNPTSGLVTALSEGCTVVYATAQDGSGKQGYCDVTVKPPVHVECVSLAPTQKTMSVGDTAILTLTICPEDATDKTVRWTSSNSNVVAVDANNGRIEAKKAGVATITVTTNEGECTASCVVTINQVLTGADLYITDQATINTIINAKNLVDVISEMYLAGQISESQMEEIQESANYTADLARADYVVVNDQSNFVYQYFWGRNYQNGDVSPFNRELEYNEFSPMKGLDVMIIQRGMQAIGIFEPEESYKYGTYDLETYTAALNNNVLWGSVFDNGAYRIVFNSTNSAQRTPEWLQALQEYSKQHRTVQLAVATRTLGAIEVKIEKGGPSGNYAGYADVLRDRESYSEIWEIKHDNPKNLSIGKNQLDRYIAASVANAQSFHTPLKAGYDISTFFVPYSSTTCLEVSSTSVGGLIFYNEIPIPTPEPDFVLAPFPESQADYQVQPNPMPIIMITAAGVTVTVVVAGIVIASLPGVVGVVSQAGTFYALSEFLRNMGNIIPALAG